MLPTHAAGGRVLTTLTLGGSPLPHAVEVVKGVEYAIFPAEPGTYAAAYTVDLDPPVISGLAVNVVTTGSANVSWQTNENASSLVEYGTAPATLNLSVSAPALVTDRTLGLTGLTGGATYHYRVTSVDPSGNSASSGILSFQAVLDTTPPVVSLVRPNGGERVFTGTPYVIHWNATDTVGVTAVDVEFSSNGGAVFAPIAECSALPGTAQTCTWTSPVPVTTQGRIRVIARDAAGNSGSATSSGNFTIVTGAASLTLTAPITAVSWTIASTQTVTFNHNFGVGQSVAVDVSRDAGATWTTVNAGFVTTNATSGSVPWVVTGPPSADARARVRWTGNPAVTSTSPVSFAIIDRITITAPNTAVTWAIGSTRSITWNHNLGAAATVNISVSRDSGTTWSVLAANVPNGAATTGTYSWIVNSPASVNARIRITSVDDPGISSVSAVDFTISGTLAITDPTGSSVWSIGSTRAVTWTHNLGAGHTFAIDLSTDNGATYPVVIASGVAGQAATGSFNWVVPGPVTAVARLRVRWTDSAAVNGTSGAFDMVAPVITVTSPNTAVSWGIGGSRAITWTHNLGAVNFDIALSTDGGATYPTTIATGVPGSATSGTYTWTVSGPALATARVRVIASSDPNLRDDSAVNFTMANPVLTLTAPTTAVNWAIGTTRAVTWNHNLGTLETVEIEKSTDGGATWTSIAAAAPNANTNGTFNWLVAGPTSATARIRVKWTDNPALVSQGAVNFTIANPTLTVTAPNTAVSWAVAASQNITFTHNLGAGIPLNVEVSRDGGATFTAITTVNSTTATSVTVPWVVTAPATTQARIRVSRGRAGQRHERRELHHPVHDRAHRAQHRGHLGHRVDARRHLDAQPRSGPPLQRRPQHRRRGHLSHSAGGRGGRSGGQRDVQLGRGRSRVGDRACPGQLGRGPQHPRAERGQLHDREPPDHAHRAEHRRQLGGRHDARRDVEPQPRQRRNGPHRGQHRRRRQLGHRGQRRAQRGDQRDVQLARPRPDDGHGADPRELDRERLGDRRRARSTSPLPIPRSPSPRPTRR